MRSHYTTTHLVSCEGRGKYIFMIKHLLKLLILDQKKFFQSKFNSKVYETEWTDYDRKISNGLKIQ